MDLVYVADIDPTIIISARYYTSENFTGARVDGYMGPVIMITMEAAQALKRVQESVNKQGYNLVIYDGYRPQRAVNYFWRWAHDISNQVKKDQYYPRVNKEKVFELGYVMARSGHSRGSTVDLTLIEQGKNIHPIKEKRRQLLDGFTITFLDDGTVDFGSSFDLFDVASHYENNLIENVFKERRAYLKNVMEKYGFVNCAEEWWHFTLKDEPLPADQDSSYLNVPVE